MNHLQPSLLRSQNEREPKQKADILSTDSGHLPLMLARVRALNHIHDAAEIVRDAMPDVADLDRPFYASIVGDLCALERRLAALNRA